ncbi:START domain-containing protein [Colwellia sp. MEBiC06753]
MSTFTLSASEFNWQLVRTSDEIKIYKDKQKDQRIVTVKASLQVKSTLSGFLLFLQDYPNIPTWLDSANHAELIEQVLPNENIFITKFNSVWPVKPRDMVIRSKYIQLDNGSIEIDVTDASTAIAPIDNSVRVTVEYAHWTIRPVADSGLIDITYQFNVDPNGAIPAWLVNQLTIDSVWKTMRNIKALLPISKWQQFQIAEIYEPHIPPH